MIRPSAAANSISRAGGMSCIRACHILTECIWRTIRKDIRNNVQLLRNVYVCLSDTTSLKVRMTPLHGSRERVANSNRVTFLM